MGGELEAATERYHAAAAEFIKGNPEPQKAVFSRGEDVSLVNPLGLPTPCVLAVERGRGPRRRVGLGSAFPKMPASPRGPGALLPTRRRSWEMAA
jgi:hypothetical protein